MELHNLNAPYSPPFHLNNSMLTKVAEIAERLGQWKQASQAGCYPNYAVETVIKSQQAQYYSC